MQIAINTKRAIMWQFMWKTIKANITQVFVGLVGIKVLQLGNKYIYIA